MSRFFYTRLAKENLKKNKSLYLPYILTAIGMSAMYYIMLAITWDKGIETMYGADSLRMILLLGCGVIAIFAVIFLF
ncbi:MAG: ABC transporter permease, partial [Clostridiales bacterium]|nr:ABC transporter permease [Clostridiales bacterium]